MSAGGNVQVVTRREVDQTLARVEERMGPDQANLLRAYLVMLESQLRVSRLGDDADPDDSPGWQGALE
jgi:hypothetical protein